MRKILMGILIGLCVFLTIIIIVTIILRFIATNSIGDSFFAINTLTEAISLFAIIGISIIDIIVISLTFIVYHKFMM